MTPADQATTRSTAAANAAPPSAALRFGYICALAVVVLSAAYFVPLVMGFVTLPSPDVPFLDPWFSMMEILIIALAPVMVGLGVAIHLSAKPEHRPFTLTSLALMSIMAAITSGVHFTVVTLSRRDDFVDLLWLSSLLSFQWPSVTYALDILAWDVFFALAVLLLVPVFGGSALATGIRYLLLVSGVLALAGVTGVIVDDMGMRNIGIIGYAVVYPVAVVLMAIFFKAQARGTTWHNAT